MKLKRTAAAVVAAVMAFTAVATPLGDNIPALEEAFSAGAYYSVKDNFYPVALTGDGAVDMVNVAVAQAGRKDDDDGCPQSLFPHTGRRNRGRLGRSYDTGGTILHGRYAQEPRDKLFAQ